MSSVSGISAIHRERAMLLEELRRASVALGVDDRYDTRERERVADGYYAEVRYFQGRERFEWGLVDRGYMALEVAGSCAELVAKVVFRWTAELVASRVPPPGVSPSEWRFDRQVELVERVSSDLAGSLLAMRAEVLGKPGWRAL